jgi:hypothetical protein
MGSGEYRQDSNQAMVSVPFIDYARGDGLSIGPGQKESWHPVVISDEVGWVHNYRGLWGLDTHDPIGGERAPAGPKYNRDGSVRQSWYDPIGWAGLDKVFPLDKLSHAIHERLDSLRAECLELDAEIDKEREHYRKRALDVEALKAAEHSSALLVAKERELLHCKGSLHELVARRAELEETQQALRSYARRVDRSDLGSPTAHLRHTHHPEPPLPPRSRVVEVWGALSGAVVLLGIALLLIFRPANWLIWLIGSGVVLGGVEALTQGRLVKYLLNITVILAVIAAIILLVEFWILVLVAGLVGVVIFVIRGNLRELRR